MGLKVHSQRLLSKAPFPLVSARAEVQGVQPLVVKLAMEASAAV